MNDEYSSQYQFYTKIGWIIFLLIFLFLLTSAISLAIYRFDHPEKTETQLMIDFFNGETFQYIFQE